MILGQVEQKGITDVAEGLKDQVRVSAWVALLVHLLHVGVQGRDNLSEALDDGL